MKRDELRTELKAFAKNLVDGYVDDATILEILGTPEVIDDYIDNQLKERWLKLPTSEQLEHDGMLETVKTQDVDRYFFKTTGTLQCSCNERCKVMDNGIMIGSVTCQNCKNCLEHDEPHPMTGTVDWIKCSKIEEATE